MQISSSFSFHSYETSLPAPAGERFRPFAGLPLFMTSWYTSINFQHIFHVFRPAMVSGGPPGRRSFPEFHGGLHDGDP